MKPSISVVVPVFNSERTVGDLCKELVEVLSSMGNNYEIIFINDGSIDKSWSIIDKLSNKYSNVIAVDLLKNYGQHSAILCGISLAKGDYLITMDDDYQNPPSEIGKLYNKILEGYDVVFAKFIKKQHALHRKYHVLDKCFGGGVYEKLLLLDVNLLTVVYFVWLLR